MAFPGSRCATRRQREMDPLNSGSCRKNHIADSAQARTITRRSEKQSCKKGNNSSRARGGQASVPKSWHRRRRHAQWLNAPAISATRTSSASGIGPSSAARCRSHSARQAIASSSCSSNDTTSGTNRALARFSWYNCSNTATLVSSRSRIFRQVITAPGSLDWPPWPTESRIVGSYSNALTTPLAGKGARAPHFIPWSHSALAVVL